MFSRVLSGALLSAAAGVAMLALTEAPASAFTLSAPSLVPAVATADVQNVYWHGHYRHWHGGWGPGWGWHHHRRCYPTPFGWRCRW